MSSLDRNGPPPISLTSFSPSLLFYVAVWAQREGARERDDSSSFQEKEVNDRVIVEQKLRSRSPEATQKRSRKMIEDHPIEVNGYYGKANLDNAVVIDLVVHVGIVLMGMEGFFFKKFSLYFL